MDIKRNTMLSKSRLRDTERFGHTDIFKVSATKLKEDLFSSEGDYQQKLENLGGVPGLLAKLQSEAATGIMGDEGDLNRRKAMFGTNDKPKPQLPPFGESLVDALNDRILVLTGGFAVLSIITGMIYDWRTGWQEGVFILIALLLQVLITACNDYSKDTQFVKLQSHALDEELPVVRGKANALQTINVWDLVVGDVVMLTRGDKTPADCVVLESVNCTADEAELTGEPYDIQKNVGDRLFAGTFIKSGEAKVLVCAVGEKSSRGIVDKLHDTRDVDTTLTKKLDAIGGSLRFIGLLAAIAILILATVILLITIGYIDGATFFKKFTDNLTLALIILIVAIPEGIPMTVGISLAYSVLYMFEKDHLLVRDLTSVETLGLVDEICMGKTGTMTTEQMEVVNFYIQDTFQTNTRKDTLYNCHIQESIIQQLKESIIYNNSAYIEMTENSFYVPVGNGTEVSLIKWLQDADIPVHDFIRQKQGRVRFSRPFDSGLQRSVIAVQHPDIENTVRVYVKGAPEIVLPKCTRHYGASGNIEAFDQAKLSYVMSDTMVQRMCSKSLRVLAFAVNDIDADRFEEIVEETNGFTSDDALDKLELGQTFLSLIALKDPARTQIRETLAYAERAKLRLRLVSGDHIETLRAFACDVGIITKEQYNQPLPDAIKAYAIEARELVEQVGGLQEVQNEYERGYAVKNLERFAELMQDLKIIARATPEDKHLIVVGLQQLDDNKVAIVGEGINDLDAFRQADVSFAMGSGCSINRNNASIVVTDDNVESIMRAFMWGRNIWLNVQRFLTFQMTCNFACLITIIVGYCFLTESPLNAVQLIWINLIMDIFGAIALSSIVPNTMDSAIPIASDRVLHAYNYRAIYGNAIWMIVIMCIVLFGRVGVFGLNYSTQVQTTCTTADCYDACIGTSIVVDTAGIETTIMDCTIDAANKVEHLTLVWNTFVFLQIWNLLNAKQVNPKKLNPFANLLLDNWFIVVVALLLAGFQYLSCFAWIGVIFEAGTVDDTQDFSVCVAFGATVLASAIGLKYMPERFARKLKMLDEDSALGADNALMKAYDKQANAKLVTKKGGAATAGAADVSGDNDDSFTQLKD